SGAGADTKPGELGADPGGLGVVEVVQDGERILPCNAGLIRVPGGDLGVADVAEGLGLAPAIPDLLVQAEGTPIAGNRLGLVGEMVVGVAQAVPGRSLRLWVVEALVQVEGPAAVVKRLPVAPEQAVQRCDRAQGDNLARLVTGGGERFQRLLGMAERVGVAAL